MLYLVSRCTWHTQGGLYTFILVFLFKKKRSSVSIWFFWGLKHFHAPLGSLLGVGLFNEKTSTPNTFPSGINCSRLQCSLSKSVRRFAQKKIIICMRISASVVYSIYQPCSFCTSLPPGSNGLLIWICQWLRGGFFFLFFWRRMYSCVNITRKKLSAGQIMLRLGRTSNICRRSSFHCMEPINGAHRTTNKEWCFTPEQEPCPCVADSLSLRLDKPLGLQKSEVICFKKLVSQTQPIRARETVRKLAILNLLAKTLSSSKIPSRRKI